MSGVILLSSSDEDTSDEPPKKRIKPTPVDESIIEFKVEGVNISNADAVIISSDDEGYEHHDTFLVSSNFSKIENIEVENNHLEAGESKEQCSQSTDICSNVTNTNLENTSADLCDTVNTCAEEPLANTPSNEVHIENVFTNHVEDTASTPLQNGNVTKNDHELRIDNVYTDHAEDSLRTPLQDRSHIKSANELRTDSVFTSHAEDDMPTHLVSTSDIRIENVYTSHMEDSMSTPLHDGHHIESTSLTSSAYSNNRLEDTSHTSVLADDIPQIDRVPHSSLNKSAPSCHSSESTSMSECKVAGETTKPEENEPTVDEMDAFLKTCAKSVKKTKYESLKEKFSVLNELYQKYILNKGYNDEVGSFLAEHITEASKSAADAVLTFNEVLEYFKAANMEEVEIAPEYKKKVKVLLKTCLKLIHRIKQLECAEVDWDDEENSAYIQEDRYKQRLVKVFNLYCKYVKMNPYQGRLTHKKLHFSASNYKDINAAINKNCQKHDKFPSYKDIEHIVRKCVKKHDLPLSESKIQRESEKCFKTVGRFLQKRRKQELYESHFYFIKDSNDPAAIDRQLDKCLKQNFAEGMRKIEMICERYAEKQMEQSQTHQTEDDSASESSSNEDSDSS